MLTREEFKKSFASPEQKILEVLLDCRDLLEKLSRECRKQKQRVSKDKK